MRLTLTLILSCAVSGCQEQILHDLSEAEANKVISRLSSSGASAEKVLQSDGRWAIAVSRDDVLPALSFLDSHRVLSGRDGEPKTKPQSGLVPSREEQWFRYERSVAKSIEESLSTMQGVLEARVHVHLPESDPLFGTRRDDRGSGSVLVVIDPRFQAKDDDLAALVAGAAGITATNVRVLRSTAPAARENIPIKVLQRQQNESSERPAVLEIASSNEPRASVAGDSAVKRRVTWGLVLCAGVSVVMLAALFARRRRPRIAFTLPTGSQEGSYHER